jgi:hypothetical protein
MLSNDERVIGIVDCPKFNGRVVMDIFVSLSFSHTEGSHGFSTVDALFGIVDHMAFH